jgi:hypothetical protein
MVELAEALARIEELEEELRLVHTAEGVLTAVAGLTLALEEWRSRALFAEERLKRFRRKSV